MGRRVNPISVRLQLNRSSDSSRFSDYDCNHGEPVYRDVNLIVYFGSIRLPTRRGKTFGFRLGRCILHHSPKRTFIHLFPPRRKIRRRRRGRSRPRKRWWAMGKGWSIGRLDRKDSTRSAFRSRAPTNYIHPPTHPYNSPPPGYRLGWVGGGEQTRVRVLSTARERETLGRYSAEYPPLSTLSIVGGWIGALKAAPTPEAVESPPLSTLSIVGGWIGAPLLWIGRERGINALKALTGLDDRSEVIWRRRSPSSQYFLGGSHKCYLRVSGWLAHKPMSVSRNSNDFPSGQRPTIYRAKCFNFLLPRIHSHSRRHSGHKVSGATLLQTIPAVRPSSNYLVMQYSFHMENRIWIWGINHFVAPDSSLDNRIRFFVESLTAKTRSATTYPARSGHYLDFLRSLLFPLLGATLFFLMENEMRGGKKKIKKRKRNARRKKLLGQLGRVLRNRLGSTRLVEQFTDLGGLVRRRIGMMIRIIPKNRRIPYGYNYYLNEVRKMRSLLSGGTNANTFIGSVKIKSVYQSASPIAQDISFQPRDGTRSFRSIFWKIVRDISLVMPKLRKGVGGIRICRPGRLKGAEIARTECREYGKTSCNTFRHQIDYAYAKVSTRYGILGVKVWIPFPRG
uniref:Ribosomal protein S3 n=1 Tax=Metasequoia glyptostroboides TaxID=3371 RepID=D2DXA0_METGY|nr:ribosomal protein S3 [Metasequoia glyptostroboides]QXE44003.1 ribosomal protein S3 [Metasequoia glyptostroboides]